MRREKHLRVQGLEAPGHEVRGDGHHLFLSAGSWCDRVT